MTKSSQDSKGFRRIIENECYGNRCGLGSRDSLEGFMGVHRCSTDGGKD